MSEVTLLRFGALEGRVLNALWTFEEATASDLHNLLNDDAVSIAVLKLALEKLRLKRMIRLRRVHRTCYYRAALDRRAFVELLKMQLAGFLGSEGETLLQEVFRAR